MSKKELTHWTNPDAMIDSQYGNITYRKWCEKEQERINVTGAKLKIITREVTNPKTKKPETEIALSR